MNDRIGSIALNQKLIRKPGRGLTKKHDLYSSFSVAIFPLTYLYVSRALIGFSGSTTVNIVENLIAETCALSKFHVK